MDEFSSHQKKSGKVISFCPGNYPDYTIQFSNSLGKHLEVILMLPGPDLERYRDSIDAQVQCVPLAGREGNGIGVFLSDIPVLIRCIISFKPDIIHIQGFSKLYGLLFFFRPFFRFSLVTTIHDVNPHLGEEHLSDRFLIRLSIKVSNHIFVHGKKLKEQCIATYNIKPDRITVIPLGEHNVAPFQKYFNPDISDDGSTILFFGRIVKYKGIEYLVAAVDTIAKVFPDIKVVIAGSGSYLDECCAEIRKDARFLVLNYPISYQEGAALFQKATVVVLPYVEASQSGVIPTTYGFKKPIIATNTGSIPEIVEDGVTGLIVPSRNPEALANAVVMVLKDSRLQRQFGEAGYKKLKSELAWDSFIHRIIDAYQLP